MLGDKYEEYNDDGEEELGIEEVEADNEQEEWVVSYYIRDVIVEGDKARAKSVFYTSKLKMSTIFFVIALFCQFPKSSIYLVRYQQ